jgi:hypothetical protein
VRSFLHLSHMSAFECFWVKNMLIFCLSGLEVC